MKNKILKLSTILLIAILFFASNYVDNYFAFAFGASWVYYKYWVDKIINDGRS